MALCVPGSGANAPGTRGEAAMPPVDDAASPVIPVFGRYLVARC